MLFRYPSGIRSMSLKYNSSPTSVSLSIVAVSDSDFASCRDICRSISVYATMFNGCGISHLGWQQQFVACSNAEAYYIALTNTSRQAVWYLNGFIQHNYTDSITVRK